MFLSSLGERFLRNIPLAIRLTLLSPVTGCHYLWGVDYNFS